MRILREKTIALRKRYKLAEVFLLNTFTGQSLAEKDNAISHCAHDQIIWRGIQTFDSIENQFHVISKIIGAHGHIVLSKYTQTLLP